MEWQETYESLLKYCQTLQKGDEGKDLAQEAVVKIIATNPKKNLRKHMQSVLQRRYGSMRIVKIKKLLSKRSKSLYRLPNFKR